MAKYLTIDIGNTTAKAMAWVDSEPQGTAAWGRLAVADIERLAQSVGGSFDTAAVCSVSADKSGLAKAASALSARCIVLSAHTPMPLDISRYAGSTLGADRIAAMAGAMAVCPGTELLVVDCGTAVTYDRVSADGIFLGGNIAPGIGMRLRALQAFTAKLPLVESNAQADLWGLSTKQAMQAGALYGVVAEVKYYFSQCPAGTRLLLTGGRAFDISSHLASTPHTCDPLLVLRGLKYIIDYNENK